MRERIWYELCQVKFNQRYGILLLARQRVWLNNFNLLILVFSGSGVMGWSLWKDLPLLSCIIIATIQLLKIIQPHLIPSDKQIEKLEQVNAFYFEYMNELEKLWYDCLNERCTEVESQRKFYELKSTEKQINKTVDEVIKTTNKTLYKQAEAQTRAYLKQSFNA